MKNFFFRIFLKALGVALFIIILSRLNWGQLFRTIFSGNFSNFVYLVFSIILFLPVIYFKALRWRFLLRNLGIEITPNEATRYYMIGLFAGSATPGQLGDFIKTVYLNKKGHPGGAAFFGVLYDRIFDLITLALVVFGGLAMLSGETIDSPLIIIFAVIILVFLLLFLLSTRFRNFIAIDVFKFLLPRGIKDRFKQFDISGDALNYQLKPAKMFFALLLSFFIYGLVFYRYYLLLLTLNLTVPFGVWFGGVAIASFVTLIPVSISGMGTRDAVLIGVFGTVNLAPEKAVAFSLLILLLMIINGIVGFVAWMKNPLIPKSNLPV